MSLDQNLNKILIIDFGSQFTQLIARRVRELGVFSEIVSHKKIKLKDINHSIKGIVLSGGPLNVYQINKYSFDKKILQLDVPVLGICFGHQILSKLNGGKVKQSKHREFGLANVLKKNSSLLTSNFFGNKKSKQVWMSHGDHVSKIAPGFEVFGTSPNAPYAIIGDQKRHFYAVQFHPEVHHTPKGRIMFENFISIANIKKTWTMDAYKEIAIKKIRKQVGSKKVICGLSGGVDSSVAAVLIHEAIGDQLTCVFVDHGLLRQGEAKEVISMFRDNYNIPLIHADESDLFLNELDGQSDPETKRKIIGNCFS